MAQKLSKKDLKREDDFVAFGHRVMSFAADNLVTVLVGLAAGLVLVASFFTWLKKQDQREIEASGRLAVGERMVGGNELELGGRRFPAMPVTDEGTLHKAVEVFETVAKDFPGGATERRADLLAGDAYLKLKDWDKAIAAYGRVKGETPIERYYALSGRGHALEGKGAYDDAASAYRSLADDKSSGYLRDLATLDLARALQEAGKADQARNVLAAFDGDDKDLRDSPFKSTAERELASLGPAPTAPVPAPSGASASASPTPAGTSPALDP